MDPSDKPLEVPSLEEVAQKMMEELGEQDAPGFTAAEYAEEWGVSKGTAQRRINKLIQKGRIIVGQRHARDATNRRIPVPVYLLRKDGEERG